MNDGDPSTLEGRKFFLNCNGKVGDMLYITDKKTGDKGHCLAEVYIYELGKLIFLNFMKTGRLGFAKEDFLNFPSNCFDGPVQ